MTLYYFTPDSASKIACSDACAAVWPPLLLSSGTPAAAAGLSGSLSVLSGPNGRQVLYDGHPLCTYSRDAKSGQANGEGIQGVWFVATPAMGDSTASSGGSSDPGSW